MAHSLERGVPHDEMLEAIQPSVRVCRALAEDRYGLALQRYGTPKIADFLGLFDLRKTITTRYGLPPDQWERVFVGNGGMEGIMFALMALTKRMRAESKEPVLLVEEFTYDRIFALCSNLGIRVVAVKLTAEGPDIQDLKTKAEAEQAMAFYHIAKHQNPCALSTPQDRIQSISRLCHRLGMVHLVDEAYHEMWFDGAHFPCQIEESTAVFFSFTKTWQPSPKLGGGIIPAWLRKDFFSAVANGRLNPNYEAQGVLQFAMERGDYDRHLEAIRAFYGQRGQEMGSLIQQYFPGSLEVPFLRKPDGGGFAIVVVPGITLDNEVAFRQACAKEQEGVSIGAPTFASRETLEGFVHNYGGVPLRVTYLSLDIDPLRIAMALVSQAHKKFLG